MFGFSRIYKMELLLKDLYYYRAHYCGLCHGLAQHYNFFYKGLTGYDTTLIALMHTAQSRSHPGQKRLRCPLNAFLPLDALPPENKSIRLASAFSVLMLHLKLQDNIRDGKTLPWSTLTSLNRKPLKKASKVLQETTGLDPAELNQLQEDLFQLEKLPHLEPGDYSIPTGQGLGRVFAAVARASDIPQNAPAMEELGYRFGRLIYLLDNLYDLEKDRSRGQFNPLLSFPSKVTLLPGQGPHQDNAPAGKSATPKLVEEECLHYMDQFFQSEYRALEQTYANLTFLQQDRLLQNIFFQGLPLELNQALNRQIKTPKKKYRRASCPP